MDGQVYMSICIMLVFVVKGELFFSALYERGAVLLSTLDLIGNDTSLDTVLPTYILILVESTHPSIQSHASTHISPCVGGSGGKF